MHFIHWIYQKHHEIFNLLIYIIYALLGEGTPKQNSLAINPTFMKVIMVFREVFNQIYCPTFYINEGRLHNRNSSLYDAVQFNSTTNYILQNRNKSDSTPLKNRLIAGLLYYIEFVLAPCT